MDVGGESVDGGAEFHWGMLHREVVGRGDWGEVVGRLRWGISVGCGIAGAARSAMSLFAVTCLRELMIREGWGGRKSQWQGNGMEQGVSLESLTCEAIAVDHHDCFRPL